MADEITLRDEDRPSERPTVVPCNRVHLREPPPIIAHDAGGDVMASIQPATFQAFGLPTDFDLKREWSHVAYGGREWAIRSASIIGTPRCGGSLDLHFALGQQTA